MLIWDADRNIWEVSWEEHQEWLKQRRCTVIRQDGQRCRAYALLKGLSGKCAVHADTVAENEAYDQMRHFWRSHSGRSKKARF